ncbi:uncharacterized protein [Pyxicephalus adspersus]|uniref:uncharacterized protein n=1 Tax=Pyxicephalus adspersus TaxID=30357 RepID=UPI003B599060
MSDIPLESKLIKQPGDRPKIFTSLSGPSVIKYSTANMEAVKGNENGSRVRRLICITDNISSRNLLNQSNCTEEKRNASADPYSRGENVITTQQGSIPCILPYNKDRITENMSLHKEDLIENYKDAIAKLRGQTAWKSYSNPSEIMVKSFHGHIQTCILQLSNRSSMPPIKLVTCNDNNSFLRSCCRKNNVSEGGTQQIQKGHHCSFPASPVISANKSNRLDGEKFVWSQNTQEISKMRTCDDKTSLVRISPLSPGKENTIHTQDVWGFPAFHPYPAKTQLHGSSSSSRGQTRSDMRTQSPTKSLPSAQSQSRHLSHQTLGSQVTLGLMLNTIRTGLKKNQIRVMLEPGNGEKL